MINNRQNGNGNGRRRGRTGNTPRPNGSGGAPDRGSRLDNRARGNASQLHEKYKTLAADAQRQGDRVMTEYYLQFADHYFRVLSETRSRFDEQQQRRDRFDGQGEEFDEGDGETNGDDRFDERPPERSQQWQQERGEADGNRDGYRERNGGQGNRNEGNRNEASRNENGRNEAGRGDSNRVDGNREGARGLEGPRADAGRDRGDDQRDQRQPREAREPRRPREQGDQRQPREQGEARPFREQGDREQVDRQQGEARAPREQSDGRERQQRDYQPREQGEGRQPRLLRRERPDEQARGPVEQPAAVEPSAVAPTPNPTPNPTQVSVPEAAELPLDTPVVEQRRPRGRPRKVVAPVEGGGERIEMDRLPPAFAAEPGSPVATDGDEEPKPRRTRRPRGEAAAV